MSNYFKRIPNIDYVSRLPNAKIGDYMKVKNLFKRGHLRDDIFQDLAVFTKYKVSGDDRPDNVAYDFYDDSNLDWLVLVSNNIINIQSEWPMSQQSFDNYLISKYTQADDSETDTYDRIYNGVHHYETIQIKNSNDVEMLAEGLTASPEYTLSYYDWLVDGYVTLSKADNEEYNTSLLTPITNYEYEAKIEDDKRNIFLLKPIYVSLVLDDLTEMMKYKKGSTEYISKSLKKAENIRLYQ
jgi:hypothetical protein